MHIIVWVVTSRLTLGSPRMPHDTIMIRFWPLSRVSESARQLAVGAFLVWYSKRAATVSEEG